MKSFVLVGLAVIAVTLQECKADLHCPNTERINTDWYKWVSWSWRGETPKNAIPHNGAIYRVKHSSSAIIVGKKYDRIFVWYNYNGAVWDHQYVTGDAEVEILTSNYPERFHWIDTNITEIQNLIGKHLVVGGCIDSYPTLIGERWVEGKDSSYGSIRIKPGNMRFEFVYNKREQAWHGDFLNFFYPASVQNGFQVLTFDDSCL